MRKCVCIDSSYNLEGRLKKMTLQQQAYGLIDKLPDDSVQVVIQVMRLMLPHDRTTAASTQTSALSPKMRAYLRMQELRKETAKYDISEVQRDAALEEKFGTFI